MSKITVVAAVVDTRQLTLYKPDGSTVTIPQRDSRLRPIVDYITPLLMTQGQAEVELGSSPSLYQKFEEQTGGVVRLFRIAKRKFKELMGDETVEPTVVGVLPSQPQRDVIQEIMDNAVPASSENFEENLDPLPDFKNTNGRPTPRNENNDTVVAVVGDQVIPGVEAIRTQFSRAAKLGSTKGVENFLKRLGAVIKQRSHSVEDLLRFMERGDLPIADDGSILIYKVLRRKDDKYVDCHTGKVTQQVGSYVCMDPKLVDHNRNNECSNGLHVARRGYISSFGGDVCVLAKLAPEDVIAVPEYDSNKMRVCGYHILFELTREQHQQLVNNRPITEVQGGKEMLAKALSGNHIGKIEEVRITKQQGGGVVITPLKTQEFKPKKVKVAKADSLDSEVAKPAGAAAVDPKKVVKTVEKLSHRQQVGIMLERFRKAKKTQRKQIAQEILNYKRSCKKGWKVLGVSEEQAKEIQDTAA